MVGTRKRWNQFSTKKTVYKLAKGQYRFSRHLVEEHVFFSRYRMIVALLGVVISGGARVYLQSELVEEEDVLLHQFPDQKDIPFDFQVWELVEEQKGGADKKTPKCILLITHSMEEADSLSNKIAILVNGRIEAYGTPQQLKSRFGAGLTVEVRVVGGIKTQTGDARDFVQKELLETLLLPRFPEIRLLRVSASGASGGVVAVMELPLLEGSQSSPTRTMAELFELLGNCDPSRVLDYSVSQSSMEDVFMRFAQQQEREAQVHVEVKQVA